MDIDKKGESSKNMQEDVDMQDYVYSDDSTSSEDSDDIVLSDLDDEHDDASSGQESYKILSRADLRKCQEDDIKNISRVLNVSTGEASLLLLNCNWNVNAVLNRWFTDDKKFRQEVGLIETPIVESSDSLDATCQICSETFLKELMAAASCGHLYCHKCWAAYIGKSLEAGLRCLKLRCPDSSCHAAVGPDMIIKLASKEEKERYIRYLLISYVDYNSKIKWCPTLRCNNAALLTGRTCSKVTCICLHSFCWSCGKESHRPVTCTTVTSWQMEHIKQAEKWTIATKIVCPQCNQSLHTSRNDKHVECAVCKYHFCRECLGAWMEHGEGQGDHFTHICSEQKLQENVNLEKQRQAQNSLTKYHECHSQSRAYDLERQRAIEEIRKLENETLGKLARTQNVTEAEVSFVREAWLRIADCKLLLKWICINDYYVTEFERNRKKPVVQENLPDMHSLQNRLINQGKVVLDRLCQRASELENFLNMEEPSDEFTNFRDRLCLATNVTKNFFENLIWALEKGPCDLDTFRLFLSAERLSKSDPASSNGGQIGQVDIEAGNWDCAHCQFPNDVSANICVMCFH